MAGLVQIASRGGETRPRAKKGPGHHPESSNASTSSPLNPRTECSLSFPSRRRPSRCPPLVLRRRRLRLRLLLSVCAAERVQTYSRASHQMCGCARALAASLPNAPHACLFHLKGLLVVHMLMYAFVMFSAVRSPWQPWPGWRFRPCGIPREQVGA